MKVLHINTTDQGGAATAIIRIHLSLIEKGVDSKILFLKKTRDIPATYSFLNWYLKNYKRNLLVRTIEKLGIGRKESFFRKADLRKKLSLVEMFSFPVSVYDITKHPLYDEADIIQLNWVSGFLDEPSFFLKNKKPVIWRMADLYASGGGNHYETGFRFSEFESEIKSNLEIRKRALKGKNITMVAISNWVKEKANESELLLNFGKEVIHNGINFNTFKIFDRSFGRELFDLPQNAKVILFGADRVNNFRKGLAQLLDALSSLTLGPDVLFCVFGTVKEPLPEYIINLGRIEDERLLSVLYSTADLFVMPSLEEAFGQVTIEALSCGTPVVSFPNGGSLDIIVSGVNGFVASDFSSVALAHSISAALRTPFDRKAIREDTFKRFNIKDKASQYIRLYEKVLDLGNAMPDS